MRRPTPARFIFEGVGTRGDVAPLIALGRELTARGHECHLLASADFGPEARAAGMHFSPTVPRIEVDAAAAGERQLARCFFLALARTDRVFRAILARAPRRTVIVNCDRFVASSVLCERDDLPLLRLHLSPFKLRSRLSPPWPFKPQADGWLGRTYRRYKLPALLQALDTDDRVLAIVNRRRSSVGLPRVTSAAYDERCVRKHVAAFPRWYCEPAADWPDGIELAGFPLPPPSGIVPAELDEFIARHGPAIVFTPGTGVSDVDAFFRAAESCCRRLAMPGIFLSRHAARFRREGGGGSGRIVALGYVDLGLFLDRTALLVHHGGIGTTARALQAGIPQIVIPGGFDQPDNGDRVTALQVGGMIERRHLSGPALAAAAAKLLQRTAVRSRLARIRESIARTSALARCADLLEQA